PGCIQLPNLVIAPVEPECSLPNLLHWPRYYFDKDLSLQAPSGGLSQAKTRPEEQPSTSFLRAADVDESDGPSFFARVARESGAVMLRCQNQEVDDGVIRQEESEDDGDHLDTDED
uniref:Elongator complex protein 5 n=1 Tax=Macrostomum lignano TaxID=282301 RepID=A0A1I8FZ84_9PLAT